LQTFKNKKKKKKIKTKKVATKKILEAKQQPKKNPIKTIANISKQKKKKKNQINSKLNRKGILNLKKKGIF